MSIVRRAMATVSRRLRPTGPPPHRLVVQHMSMVDRRTVKKMLKLCRRKWVGKVVDLALLDAPGDGAIGGAGPPLSALGGAGAPEDAVAALTRGSGEGSFAPGRSDVSAIFHNGKSHV